MYGSRRHPYDTVDLYIIVHEHIQDSGGIYASLAAALKYQTCLCPTTLDEYRKNIEKDAALERRFQPVQINEPSAEDAVEILKGLRDKYEAHHRIKIPDEAIEAAVKLSVRYVTGRYLPDKAIDVIDEACSRVRLSSLTTPPDLKQLEDEIAAVSRPK